MTNFTIKDNAIYLESDSRDNPIIPHLDSDGRSIAKFDPPYTIIEGLTARLSGKTLTMSMSGKRGNFVVVKIPAEAILTLASAIEECSMKENPINKETLENLEHALSCLDED